MTSHPASSISPQWPIEAVATTSTTRQGHAGDSGSGNMDVGTGGASSSTTRIGDAVNTEHEEDEQETEAAPIRVQKDPGCPTAEEVETHNLTHLPHRSWCPICVKARGKEDGHFRSKDSKEGRKPTVSFDYKSFGQDGDEDDKVQSIVVRDNLTKTIYTHQCVCK